MTKRTADDIFDLLLKVCNLLESIDIRYTLSSGTLLGALRENDIIPWDTDFDIDVFNLSPQETRFLEIELDNLGIRVAVGTRRMIDARSGRLSYRRRRSAKLKLFDTQSGAKGDLLLFQLCEDGLARRVDGIHGSYACPRSTNPAEIYLDRAAVEVRGRTFPAPRKPVTYIESFYGSDWKKPLQPGQFDQARQPMGGMIMDRSPLPIDTVTTKQDPTLGMEPHVEVASIIRYIDDAAGVKWIRDHDALVAKMLDRYSSRGFDRRVSMEQTNLVDRVAKSASGQMMRRPRR